MKLDENFDVVVVGYGYAGAVAAMEAAKDCAPIPRPFAAGEIGSCFGHLYFAGGNIAECFASGWTAGRNAAKLDPC